MAAAMNGTYARRPCTIEAGICILETLLLSADRKR